MHGRKKHQITYERNNSARSRNYYCRRKGISIKYSDCVFVVLVIQHACNILVVCYLPGATIFFPYYLIKGMIYNNKNTFMNVKCVF